MQPWGHDSLQVFKNLCPGESFALEKIIQKLRAVACIAVFRPAQQRFGLGLFLVTGRNLCPALPDQVSIFTRADPTRERAVNQY